MAKTFTLDSLISVLNLIRLSKPGDTPVYVYIQDLSEIMDDGDSPLPILLVDADISDRIDLNI